MPDSWCFPTSCLCGVSSVRNPVKATPLRWNSQPHPQRPMSPKTSKICAQWDAWDWHTRHLYSIYKCYAAYIWFCYSMISSWDTYTPHFLNNGIASWRNEIIYTSFLWSQYYLYHNHGQAREWREMTGILYKWNKYNFRNTDWFPVEKFFHLLPYGLHFTLPHGADDQHCIGFQWIKTQ